LPTGITAIAPVSTLVLFGLHPDSVLAPLAICTLFSALLFVLGARWTVHPIYEEIKGLYSRLRRPG